MSPTSYRAAPPRVVEGIVVGMARKFNELEQTNSSCPTGAIPILEKKYYGGDCLRGYCAESPPVAGRASAEPFRVTSKKFYTLYFGEDLEGPLSVAGLDFSSGTSL